MRKEKDEWLINQLRVIASRGRLDDADVVILFDAADEYEHLLTEAYIHGL